MTKKPFEDLRQGIVALTPSEQRVSKRQMIGIMIQEIDDAMKRGVTLEQIKTYLDGKGFELGLGTLRQYVAEARKTELEAAQQKAMKTAPKSAASTSKGKQPEADAAAKQPRRKKSVSSQQPDATAPGFVQIDDEDL